jgi:hypothetical protein
MAEIIGLACQRAVPLPLTRPTQGDRYQQTGRVEEARRTAEQLIAARKTHSAAIWRVLRPIPLPLRAAGFRWVERSPGRPGAETSFSAPRNVEMT